MLKREELLVIRELLMKVRPSQGRTMHELRDELRIWQSAMGAVSREIEEAPAPQKQQKNTPE